jgi:hypothetical protein
MHAPSILQLRRSSPLDRLIVELVQLPLTIDHRSMMHPV